MITRKKDENMSDIEKIFTSDFRNCCVLYGALVSRRECQCRNILRIFAEISRSFSLDADLPPFSEIYRCTWRDVIDTIRHSEKKGRERDGESISSIKTRRSTKIHSTRRSSLSPYLLCNTKYTLGNRKSTFAVARHRYIDFSSRGTNIRGTRKPRFFGHVSFRSIGHSVNRWNLG